MAQAQNEKTSAAGRETGGAQTRAANEPTNDASGADKSPIEMLRADHRKVEQLFGDFEKAGDSERKTRIARDICTELTVHTLIEEEIFYPSCQGHMDDRLLDEAQVEHDGAKALIVEIESGSPDDKYFNAKVKVLADEIKHHIQEEEKPGSGIFAKAKQAGLATPELAQRLTERKRELLDEASAGRLRPPETRSLRAAVPYWASHMREARRSTRLREREENGRFVSDDGPDYRRTSRRDWEEEDYRRAVPPRNEEWRFLGTRYEGDRRPMPPRDEEGRFVSRHSRYDDDDEYRRGIGGRYRDDDDRRLARSRRDYDDDERHGHGGWYGDPRGHSEAARRGWEERGGGRYRDDDRFYARSRRDYDDDERHGHGGWYGDPQGHSEAARRGWEAHGGARYRDDDDERGRSRRSDEDDWRRRR